MKNSISQIGIVGATGYTGEELLRVIVRHPQAELAFATSEQEQGQSLAKVFPHLPRYHDRVFCSAQESLDRQADFVFLCTPAGQSAKWAEQFLAKKVKVVDLGADFRFYQSQDYERWYGQPHPFPALLTETVYGLPEWNRDAIKNACVVGNPGCYPTSALLGILPFIQAGIVADGSIVIDAKSGVSGAGKSPSRTTHYVEVNESLNAYKPGRAHRHVGEMEQELGKLAGHPVQIVFTPHLTPMSRGLFSTIYFNMKKTLTSKELLAVLSEAYEDEPFVHVLEEGLPTTKMALHSNHCFLSAEVVTESNMAMVFSAIDNLGKGASWQAVQNMNLMLGFPEEMGLI
jgi:N-acetyl-gamma-glutamyl-phosphate reductase